MPGLLAFLPVRAQFPAMPVDSTMHLNGRWGHVVQVEGMLDFNATTLENGLVVALWEGGMIGRDLRERGRDRLNTDNRAGLDLQARATWTGRDSLFGHARLRPMVSVAYNNLVGLRYTQDLYALTFFGNADYADRTAFIGGSGVESITYQSIGFGVRDAASMRFARLELLKGQALSVAAMDRADLYTAPDGLFIRADIAGEYLRSDTAGSDFADLNGWGMALSGRWEHSIRSGRTRVVIGVEVQDLGFMRWGSGSQRLDKDTLIVYEGFDVAGLLDLDAAVIGEDQLLDTLGLRTRPGAFTRLAPFRAALTASMDFGTRWHAGVVLEQRNLIGRVPQVSFTLAHRLGERGLLAAGLSEGGAGSTRLHAGGRIPFGDRVLLDLHATHVPGFFKGTARAAGLLAMLSVGF